MLAGNTVIFRLLASGREAMKDLSLESEDVEAFVVAEDQRGGGSLWSRRGIKSTR